MLKNQFLEKWVREIVPLGLVVGIATWSVWPLLRCGNCIANFGRDGELITWIINTAGKNLYGLHSGGVGQMFGGNIFYPYKNVLAYSDMFFVTSAWVYPVSKLVQNPGIVDGLAVGVGQIGTMLITYLWWKKLSKNTWASLVGTGAFGLSQMRLEYQVHLQMWGLQYMLIGSWLVCSWLEDKKDWKLFLGTGILGLQVWESLLPVYFATLVLSAQYLVLRPKAQVKKLILAGVLFGTISVLPLKAYWGVGREFNFRRDIREAAHNGMSVDEIWGKFGSPGLYILFAVAIWQIAKSKQKSDWGWLGLVLGASLIMAMGPVVKWQGQTVKLGGRVPVPLPYAAAYYLVPGFEALRTPSRWIWMAGWAASGVIAIGITNFQFSIFNQFSKSNIKTKHYLGLLGALLVAIVGGTRITKVRKLPTYETMPGVYKWLARQPGKVVLEVPMGDENIETERMVYSLYHEKTLVNGFSGFTPPGYYEMAKWVNDGLVPDEVTKLKRMGVDYVIWDSKKAIEL